MVAKDMFCCIKQINKYTICWTTVSSYIKNVYNRTVTLTIDFMCNRCLPYVTLMHGHIYIYIYIYDMI